VFAAELPSWDQTAGILMEDLVTHLPGQLKTLDSISFSGPFEGRLTEKPIRLQEFIMKGNKIRGGFDILGLGICISQRNLAGLIKALGLHSS
jgi:hypothetical protein